ncbi:MAG: UDP-3-O-(3-hydroxymyristoyl)glucosamine N-acyltransferase [Alphaproteobacteria bacterium]
MKLSDIATALGAKLAGDGDADARRVVHPSEAREATDLALAMERETLALLAGSPAGVAVVAEGSVPPEGAALRGWIEVARPRYAMAGLLELFARPVRTVPGVHPSAVVEPSAMLGRDVSIGPFVYIGANAVVGDGSAILSHTTVGTDARIGRDCLVHPGVRIGERVVLGDRVIVHQNASLGADGFSFVTPERGSVEQARTSGVIKTTNTVLTRINSIGSVAIGDDVEIGACTAIDRGTVSDTRIGRGTKIDDLVMIGHNVVVGENCMLCGQVGIAGSAKIGNRVVLAGQVGVADHVSIGDDSVVGGGSGVGQNVPPKSVVIGYPALPRAEKIEEYMYLKRLRTMHEDIRALKRRVKAVESAGEKR